MAKKNEITTVDNNQAIVTSPAQELVKQFEVQQRMAQMYVQSTIVPDTYKGNIGNCVIAIDMAMRMGANPLMIMQNLYIVHGNPGWSSKFLISCINMCGRFTPLRYQFYGKRGTDLYGCRAYAYERSDREHKEPLSGVWVTIDMAKKEGWYDKKGSKWRTIPDQMLMYRAAAFWQRAYAPEIGMGFLTKEEIEDAVVVEELPVTAPTINDNDEPIPVVDGDEPVAIPDENKDEQKEETKEQPKQNAKDVVAEALNKQNNIKQVGENKVDVTTGELFDQQTQEG